MDIPGWTNVTNSFALVDDDSFTHSTREGADGYVVGGDFDNSEIEQTQSIPDGYRVGARAVLTFQRANVGTDDDLGEVVLEALDGSDVVLDSESTGQELFAADSWNARRLVLDIPVGATQLRVRLLAERNNTGNSSAAFDDFDLRMHKLLDPSYAMEFDFTQLANQPTPRNWQRWHLAWPEATALPECVVAHGSVAISAARPFSGETIAWSDSVGNAAVPFVGNFGIAASDNDYITSNVYRSAFQFVYQGPHLQLTGTGTGTSAKRRGKFSSADSFAVRVVLKARAYGSGAGICGVRDTTSGVGWGLSLTSSGLVRATLAGSSGTKTATSAATIADGAVHQVVMVFDAAGQSLKLFVDRLAAVTTSTSSGLGEFALTGASSSYPLRIGTDRSGTDVFGGEILEVDIIPSGSATFTQAEIWAMWPYGAQPNDAIEMNLSHAVWVPAESSTDVGGTALVRCAVNQMPQGYKGSEYGLAIGTGSANLWPSNDTTSTTAWVAESTVTAARSIADNTGLARGIRITGDATHGLVVPNIAITAVAGTVNLVVYARATSGTPALGVELLSSADVLKDSDSFVLSTSWQVVPILGLSWDGATATCKLRFRSAGAFELAHVAWVELADIATGARFPPVIQDAGVTLENVYATVDVEHPARLNDEGEIDVAGIGMIASPLSGLSIAVIGTSGGDTATRSLYVGGSQKPTAGHYDSAGSGVTAEGTAIDWSEPWRVRNRWNRSAIASAAGDTFAGIVVDASADSSVEDARTAAWTAASDPLDITWIGHTLAAVLGGYVRRFAVRAREARL